MTAFLITFAANVSELLCLKFFCIQTQSAMLTKLHSRYCLLLEFINGYGGSSHKHVFYLTFELVFDFKMRAFLYLQSLFCISQC